jgi:hypothetical protein
MPPIPPGDIGGVFSFSGISVTEVEELAKIIRETPNPGE